MYKFFVAVTFALFLPGKAAIAACTVPNTLTNGTPADATQVMANFTSIVNCAAPTASPSFTGNVGIGTGSPAIPGLQIGTGGGLQAYGNAEIALRSNSYYDGSNNRFLTASGYASSLVADHGGNLIYYTSTATSSGAGGAATFTQRLQIAQNGNATFSGSGGTCTINGSGSCTSDRRLKKDVKSISGPAALTGLSRISGVTYRWKGTALDQNQRVGVIAQDVISAFPQLVGKTEVKVNGSSELYYTVDYAGLVAPIISAVNELNRRVEIVESARNGSSKLVRAEDGASVLPPTEGIKIFKMLSDLKQASQRQAEQIAYLESQLAAVRSAGMIKAAAR